MAAAPPPNTRMPPTPPPRPYDLDLTVVSAKHLKNVNWRNGELKPYVIFWVDLDRRQATKADESGSTRPVWNERFVLPLSLPPNDAVLTLEIFHSRPSETPKPLVGSLRFELKELLFDPDDSTRIRTFELKRPSGRPQGKIRLKLSLRDRPSENYQTAPASGYYYSAAPSHYRGYAPPPLSHSSLYSLHPAASQPPPPAQSPPPPPQPVSLSYSYAGYSDHYQGYHPGYYSQLPPVLPPRPMFDQQSSYGGPGPSAPVDYTPSYDNQKRSAGKMGTGTGMAAGAVAGALGGLTLDEGIKREEDKISERAENELASSRVDRYSDYRTDY